MVIIDDEMLEKFYSYLRLEKGIREETLKRYIYDLNRLRERTEGKLTYENVREYLWWVKNELDEDTYRNSLINIRVFLRWLA